MARLQQCAKDYDPALLKDCTVDRMSSVPKNYDFASSKFQKPHLYKAIFEAMLVDAECNVCQGKL